MNTETGPAKDPKWPGRVGVALGLLLVLGLAALCMAPSNSNSGDAPDRTDAYITCKNFIEDRLKAPSSADFRRSDTSITSIGSTWTVAGPVDAENSFGASLRMNYTCVIRIKGETWHLESLTGLE